MKGLLIFPRPEESRGALPSIRHERRKASTGSDDVSIRPITRAIIPITMTITRIIMIAKNNTDDNNHM